MEHGEEILDLELVDRIDLHDLTAVCALRGLLRVLAGRFQCSINTLFRPLHGLSPRRAHGQTTLQWPTPRLLDRNRIWRSRWRCGEQWHHRPPRCLLWD